MNPQTVYITLRVLRRVLTLRTLKRVIATVCLVSVLCAAYIYDQSRKQDMPPVCGVGLQYDPFAVRAFRLADKSGNLIARLLTEPLPSDETFAEYLYGTLDVLKWFGITLTNPIRGAEHFAGIPEDGGAGSNPYGVPVPCTPPGDVICEPDQGPTSPMSPADPGVPAEPWDPKNASLTGPALAADALRKAGFPTDEIPTFVAIAKYETGFRNISGPTVGGGTMRGMWQLNDRYWHLENWQDPYANAVMAKRVRDESVAAGRGPYSPWSTSRAAVRDAHLYASFGATGAGGLTPTPAVCVPSSTGSTGSVNATVATWNVQSNRDHDHGGYGASPLTRMLTGAREIAQTADVINFQELADESRRARVESQIRRTHTMVNFGTATPLAYRTSKFRLIDSGRVVAISGVRHVEKGAAGSSTVGPKWLVWALLEPKNPADGVAFYDISTHMPATVDRGGQWDRSNPRRVKAYRDQLAVAMHQVDKFRATGRPGMIAADWNVTFDPDGQWAAHGLTMVGNQPTHGGRLIDRVLSWGTPPANTWTMPASGSDHRRTLTAFRTAVATPVAAAAGPGPAEFDQQGNPRTVEQAIAWLKAAMPNGAPGERVSNRCERYMNLSFGQGGGYDSASAHWNASGPKHQGDPPRGALVFWETSQSAGHVALSVGGGRVISTDYNAATGLFETGRISEGPITDIDRWGTRLGWRAPNFNT